MTYSTEGMSPLEHFNLVMEGIRAGRGLARPPTDDETIWRRDCAPAHVDGVSVLMVVISRHGGIANHVENYELLLKATYGDGGWIGKGCVGEQDPNVKIQGPGYPTFIEFYGKYVRGVNYVRDDRIDEAEMAKIIYGEAVLGGGYDQIHIVGHGDDGGKYGMLFYRRDDEGKRVTTGRVFDGKKTKILYKYHSWPLNPDGKVLLVGCQVDRGPLYELILGLLGEDNVYAVSAPVWKCLYGGIMKGDKVGPRVGALDWYHPKQDESTRAIGEWLNVPHAREYD